MNIEYGALSDVGRIRGNNEDSFALDFSRGIFIVCDGMGGAKSGEVASRMAADIISNNLKLQLDGSRPVKEVLASSIKLANKAIYEASVTYPDKNGMGTTVVAAVAGENSYTIGWVGDSRIYLVRHGRIQQLSADHSLVQEQIDKGLITPEQAEVSEYKNVLTKALGTQEDLEPSVEEVPSFDDDYIILCSDGLTMMVDDKDILETVKTIREPEVISKKLIELANQAGGRDNVTAIVLWKKPRSLWNKLVKTVVKR